MDWARAKNILIILLFALNLTLAATIVSRVLGGGADRELYSSVTRILNDRGVVMQCDYPKQITSSELLIYGDGARFVEQCARALSGGGMGSAWVEMLGRESLIYTNMHPNEGLNTSTISALDTAIRRELGERGVDLAGFTTDYATRGGDGNYFFQYILDYKGKLVFDSIVNVTVNADGGITEISLSYREIKSASIDKLMKVIPAYQVLLKNYYDNGSVVASINIGFMGQNTARENPFIESEEGAVWRVRLDDGTERFFEATYGDEIYLYSHI
ncbi:MAG: two-component system regulatory protein YycI [Oscillospiraceae bacterium]|nr:two-component system regulatory protein YycI [Oscillospiraceae bacterium]